MSELALIPEPPPGATVTDNRGHVWKRDNSPDYPWTGCYGCDKDGSEIVAWSWWLILYDTFDTELTVTMP